MPETPSHSPPAMAHSPSAMAILIRMDSWELGRAIDQGRLHVSPDRCPPVQRGAAKDAAAPHVARPESPEPSVRATERLREDPSPDHRHPLTTIPLTYHGRYRLSSASTDLLPWSLGHSKKRREPLLLTKVRTARQRGSPTAYRAQPEGA